MYYFIEKGSCKRGYHFLYNDEDKSVIYASPSYIRSVEISNIVVQDDKSSFNKYKLMFEKVYDDFMYHVCQYSVDNIFIVMYLCITGENSSIMLTFHDSDLSTIGVSCNNKFKNLGFNCSLYYSKSLLIPFRMIDYILNLKSNGDFNGIMQAFDGIIGVDLYKFVSEINSSVVKFRSWEA